jgi:DNA-binding LytR/AlgR family response regulator
MIVLPAYFKNIFNIKKWNVLYEILWDIWLAVTVGIGYYVYFRLTPIFTISLRDAATIVLTSIFTISILVVLNQNRLVKLNLNDAIELNKRLLEKYNQGLTTVKFDSEYKKDSIEISIEKLKYLKSAGNYVEIYYEDNGLIRRHLVRNTLKNFEEKLKKFNFIFKCHRTYIVNTKQIERVEGDPQGLKLILKDVNKKIPVSRNFVNKLKGII